MNKTEEDIKNPVEVFIDFEAITNPFARLMKSKNSTPFCYTLGLKNIKNEFKTKTYIYNFKTKNVYETLKEHISKDIKQINNTVKIPNVVFVGHNPTLEKELLSIMFPNNVVKALIEEKNLSLSVLTAKDFSDDYFVESRKAIREKAKNNVVEKVLQKDGSTASYIGFLLWCQTKKVKNPAKFIIDVNPQILVNELKRYSKDDVLRMEVLSRDENLKKNIESIKRKRMLLSLIKNLNLEDSLTVKEIKEKIWQL
ncbi:DUF2779 domain-containing protein [[Mycoplasma] gypis]|uniref:DUF2779 domain-containing protein n=1 Tax=[Mycoplasma] gypis TaxID=92404 RepID=A0ABZ2RMM3_9BACT|nr:DUF2779 domain-containing protein [[Mycoplasma] gypis]MBN0919669.1 DUF2779 domain-containing protein [[Mycoplasma] gypis]